MEDNWREELNNDNNFNQDEPYSLSKILEKLDKITDLEHINPYYILSPLYDFTKIFGRISSALGLGFKDITTKVNLMREIFKGYPEITNIQDLLLTEIKLNVHELRGDNCAEKGFTSGKYSNYISGSRTFLRLLWFMEYLITIFRRLVTQDDKTLKEILKSSYNDVLAPRHTWLVRQAVGAALLIAGCTKEEAVIYMFEVDTFNEESKKKITMVTDKMQTIWKAGYDFYTKNNLQNLK